MLKGFIIKKNVYIYYMMMISGGLGGREQNTRGRGGRVHNHINLKK